MAIQWETREEWGSLKITPGEINTLRKGIVIHWAGPGNYASESRERNRELVRAIQRYHVGKEYYDIAYGSIVCADGVVMEGRTRQDNPYYRVGSNGTYASNSDYTSILCLRGDQDGPITQKELEVLAELVAWYRMQGYGPELKGHREIVATPCPGDAIYYQLPMIRQNADVIIANEGDIMNAEQMEELAALTAQKTVNKLLRAKMTDGALAADHPKREVSFYWLMSRIAGRTGRTNAALQVTAEEVAAAVRAELEAMDFGADTKFTIVAEDNQIVVKPVDG